jgi:hypothetical protein
MIVCVIRHVLAVDAELCRSQSGARDPLGPDSFLIDRQTA